MKRYKSKAEIQHLRDYKSHHSGIETELEDAAYSNDIAINRTTLELKRRSFNIFREGLFYKSHHSGIETLMLIVLRTLLLTYKSHHSGIETWLKASMSRICITINRTTLELKRYIAELPENYTLYKSHHSGIETSNQLLDY